MRNVAATIAVLGTVLVGCTPDAPPEVPTEFDAGFETSYDADPGWDVASECGVEGTGGDDYLETTADFQHVCAGAGNDRIRIRHNKVYVHGGSGNDTIIADNVLQFEICPGPGEDDIQLSNLKLDYGPNYSLSTVSSTVCENGAQHRNRLELSDGTLIRYPDNGAGDDRIVVDGTEGWIGLNPGSGDDHVEVKNALGPFFERVAVRGGDGDDVIRVSGLINWDVDGGTGHDYLVVLGGIADSTIVGGSGSDVIFTVNGFRDTVFLDEKRTIDGIPVSNGICTLSQPLVPTRPGNYALDCNLPLLGSPSFSVTVGDDLKTSVSGSLLGGLVSADISQIDDLLTGGANASASADVCISEPPVYVSGIRKWGDVCV